MTSPVLRRDTLLETCEIARKLDESHSSKTRHWSVSFQSNPVTGTEPESGRTGCVQLFCGGKRRTNQAANSNVARQAATAKAGCSVTVRLASQNALPSTINQTTVIGGFRAGL